MTKSGIPKNSLGSLLGLRGSYPFIHGVINLQYQHVGA